MNENERKVVVRRMLLLIAVACIIMGLYTFRLIFLQLVNGDSFKAKATNTTDYKFTVTAARGNIVDSTGKRIATTSTGYNVVLNKLQMGDQDLDTMLQQIVELLRKNDEKWLDTLLISEPDAAGNYTFTDSADSTSDQKTLADMKETLGLQQYATANDVMEMLVEKNDLQDFSPEWQRVLAGIHYEMDRQAFSNVNNFVMAENVSQVTVATIKEHSLTLPGVEIVETSTRSYEQGDILPAVLGRVGKITAEKWKVTDENGQVTYPLKEKGYNMNDVIGISGLESVYEDELRGKDGVETITRNSDGVIVDTKITTVPEPGHTVQLTINSDFQRAVDKALANNIDMINRVYNTGDMKAAACAAVRDSIDAHKQIDRRIFAFGRIHPVGHVTAVIDHVSGLGLQPVQQRHKLGAGAGGIRQQAVIGALEDFGVDCPRHRLAGIRGKAVIVGILADRHAALRSVEALLLCKAPEHRDRLLTGHGIHRAEGVLAETGDNAETCCPADSFCVIGTLFHIRKVHRVIHDRLSGGPPEEGHKVGARAVPIRCKYVLADTGCDFLFDRPVDSVIKIILFRYVCKRLCRFCGKRLCAQQHHGCQQQTENPNGAFHTNASIFIGSCIHLCIFPAQSASAPRGSQTEAVQIRPPDEKK